MPDSDLHHQTACQGTEVSLSCHGEARISLVRAVWGRYSLAICNSGARDFLQMLRSTTCGDRVTPLQLMRERCEGEAHCSLLADTAVLGDPCPGVEEFLEVQFKCVETARRPEFPDNRIAHLWSDNKQIDEIIFEELPVMTRADTRIPITEASTAELYQRDPEEFFTERRSEERRTLMIVATVCLLMLPVIIVLTVLILRTNNEKKSSCEIHHSQLASLSKPNLLFCRLEAGGRGGLRKFSSEPSLVAHNCLLDSSSSLLRYS